MAFPVDILTNVDYESLDLAAKKYWSQLPCRNPEYLTLPDSKQMEIELRNVTFLPLYGAENKRKLLALLSPNDTATIVGLYLLDRWWGVEDVLKTAQASRTGLIKVSTLVERIVLYVLNRIVLRKEKGSEEDSFLLHCEDETAKILWKDGEAIGFYSFKPKGSLCIKFLTQCYQLPVMDTIFVRKCHRGKGHGVKILEDFVSSFKKEDIGLKCPLSEAMYKVCEKYFSINPADKELLWEVEEFGSPFQRTPIAKMLQRLTIKEKDQVVSKLNFEEDVATSPKKIEITKIQETTKYTVEIAEKTITDIAKEADDIPVTRRGKGSNLKRKGIRENSEESLSKNTIRVEDIESGVKSPVEMTNEENIDNRFSVKESEAVLRSIGETVTATLTNITELRGSQSVEEQRNEKDVDTSEKTSHSHFTSAEKINSQGDSEDESEVFSKEQTVELQETTIGSIDQRQLRSVVDVEIVKMSTGTEEEQYENLQNNKEAGVGEIKQMLAEAEGDKAVSETAEAHVNTEALNEVIEKAEIHAKQTEPEQAHWDVEKPVEKERAENEILEECGMDLSGENINDNIDTEKCEANDEAQIQSVQFKDQSETEVHVVDSVREVHCTEEHLSEDEWNETRINKDILIKKAKEEKLIPDEEEQVFPRSKLPQKRTSVLTPSRRSKRLRHEPAETDLKTTKSVKTTKHHRKAVIQKDLKQPINEPEHQISEVTKENSLAAKVAEYKGNDKLTVKTVTVTTMDTEITQVEEIVDIVPDVSELVEKAEIDQEEEPRQSYVDPTKVQDLMHEKVLENNIVTLSEARIVLVDLHELSSKEVGDELEEMDKKEKEVTKRTEEEEIPLDIKTLEKPACTSTAEEYNVSEDTNVTLEQSTAYKEGEVELETTDVVVVDKPDEKKELQKSTETNDTERGSQIAEATKKDTVLLEAEPEDVTEKEVEEIKKMDNKENNLARESDSDIEMSDKSSSTTEKTVNVHISVSTTETRLEILNEMVNTNIETTADVDLKSSIQMVVDLDNQEEEFQMVACPEEISLVEAEHDEEVEKEDGTPVIQFQKHTVVLEDMNQLTQNTDKLIKTPDVLTHSQTEQQLELNEADKSEKEMCNLASEGDINQEKINTQENTEKISEAGKMEEENTDEEQKKHNKQDMTFKEQKQTEVQSEDKEVSSLTQEKAVQENFEEEALVSTERSLRRRTIQVQSVPKRKSRCAQKQQVEDFKNKTENVTITGKGIEEIHKEVVEIDYKDTTLQKSTVDATKKVVPLVEAELEAEKVAEEIKETSEMGEEAILQQYEIEPLVKEKAETEQSNQIYAVEKTSVEETVKVCIPVIAEEATLENPDEMQNMKKVGTRAVEPETSELIMGEEIDAKTEAPQTVEDALFEEAEPEEEAEKDNSPAIIQLQKATVVLVDINRLPQNTEGGSDTLEVLPQREELDKSVNREHQLCSLTSEEQEQQEVQKEGDIEKTPDEDKMEEGNAFEDQNELKEQEVTFEGQKPIEDLKEQNYVIVTESVDDYRDVISGEHPEGSTMAGKTTIVQQAEKDQDASLKEQSKDSDVETSRLVQEVPETVEEILKEETPVSTERTLRRRTIQVQAAPKRKSRRVQKQQVDAFEDKTILTTGKGVGEIQNEGAEIYDNEEIFQKSSVEACLKSLDKMSSTDVEKTAEVETKSSLQMGIEVDYQEQEFQIVACSEAISIVEAEHVEDSEKEDGTPVNQLQKATVVIEDLNQLEQNTYKKNETPDVLTHSKREELMELDEADECEQGLCNLASNVDKKEEIFQIQQENENIPEAETMEEENTDEEHNKLNKGMAFEEQKSTEFQSADEGEIGLTQGEVVQENLEEEALFSTERSLRRRTIQVQSVPKRKSRRVQKKQDEDFEDKTEKVPITGKGIEQTHEQVEKINDKPTVEATEEGIPLTDHDVTEKAVEEIREIGNIAIDLWNEVTSEIGREAVSVEQNENEPLGENEKESAETEKPTAVDDVPEVSKQQTCIIEETTIQVEEKVPQIESSETNESKIERITRRSLRIGTQSVTSTQKTRISTHLHAAELELVKEAVICRNEDTSPTVVDAVNACIPIITEDTNVENLIEAGGLISMSRKEEAASDEQNIDMADDKGMVDESLYEKSTDKEEDEIESLVKTTENESEMEMDKSQTVVEEGIQDEEKTEPSQENTQDKEGYQIRTDSVEEDNPQQEVEAQEENLDVTDSTDEFKTPVALKSSDQDVLLITRRNLRSRTVTVQSTPRRKYKRQHRLEKETKNICEDENCSAIQQSAGDLNIPIQMENEEINTEKSTAELENLDTKGHQDIIILNTAGAEDTEAKDDSVEEGNEILLEIMQSNNASPGNTVPGKTQEENLEREDAQEHEEKELANAQENDKTLQESQKGPVAEDSSDLKETAMERRSLRKRTTAEAAAPRTSKRLCKQDKDTEQIKEAGIGETESVELTSEASNVERSSVPEDSNLGEEILQEVQNNADGIRSYFNILGDTETSAASGEEEQQENRINPIQTDEDYDIKNNKAEGSDEIVEEVIKQHVETEEQNLDSSANECFTLELEAEETLNQEENNSDGERNMAEESPKEIISQKSHAGEESISNDDEEGLAIEKYDLQSGSATTSTRRRSARLLMHESKKKTEKDESDSEDSEVQQTAKQRYQKKRKAITDSTSSRISKRYVRAKIV